MRYLCLVYGDEKQLDSMAKRDFDGLTDDSLDYDDVLKKGGNYLASAALQHVETATTIRVRNAKVSVTDGPFAETKEQLCGFILITARDLNEAIQLASKIPSAQWGSVEVRPVQELAYSSDERAAEGR
jgi:hypothetical protein